MVVVTEWTVSPVKSQDPQAVVQRLMCPPSRKKTLAEVREVCSAAIFFGGEMGIKHGNHHGTPPQCPRLSTTGIL